MEKEILKEPTFVDEIVAIIRSGADRAAAGLS